MNILTTIPFALDQNLGRAYNDVMESLPADGWACLLDHDMMFTTSRWYAQLQEAAAFEPTAMFTACTNRMHAPWQKIIEGEKAGDDINRHRAVGNARLAKRTVLDVTNTQGLGGVLMLLSKETWQAAGGFVDGLFCVDHMMHYAIRDAGRRVYMIEGLYVYHFRGSSRNAEVYGTLPHAKDARTGKTCPCRTIKQTVPIRRCQLPVIE